MSSSNPKLHEILICIILTIGFAAPAQAQDSGQASCKLSILSNGIFVKSKAHRITAKSEDSTKIRLQFSEPVKKFTPRNLSVRNAAIDEFGPVNGNESQASIFDFKIKGRFSAGLSSVNASLSLEDGKAKTAKDGSRVLGCGPLLFTLKKTSNLPTLSPTKIPQPSPLPTTLPTAPTDNNLPQSETETPTPTSTSTATPRPTSTSPAAPTVTLNPTARPTTQPTKSVNQCSTVTQLQESNLPAFPSAEGFGTKLFAGSGRHLLNPCTVIYKVNNLNDNGPGSLRDCMEASGPRVCIFEISGMIWARKELKVKSPYLTVAGQTAPSPGIMIRGSGISVEASEVLIQHLRVRPGDDTRASCCASNSCGLLEQQFCTQDPGSRDGVRAYASTGPLNNIVFDHVSIEWALDEGFSLAPTKGDISNVTFSNSIIGSGLDMSIHPEASIPSDPGHSKAVLFNGDFAIKNVSFHKNLLAHNADRNIRISTPVRGEIINNIVYDWGRGRGAGRLIELTSKTSAVHQLDIIGNLYQPGLDTFCPQTQYLPERCFENGQDGIDTETERQKMHFMLRVGSGISGGLVATSRYFLQGNISQTRPNTSLDEWNIADPSFFTSSTSKTLVFPGNKASSPVGSSGTVTALPVTGSFEKVLTQAGARPNERDSVDAAIENDVRNGTGRIINCVSENGTSRCQKNAGGWPEYPVIIRSLTLPADMLGDSNGNGYTNLDEWLNTFSTALEN